VIGTYYNQIFLTAKNANDAKIITTGVISRKLCDTLKNPKEDFLGSREKIRMSDNIKGVSKK